MTPLHEAAKAAALVESGYSHRKTSKLTGLSAFTVGQIVDGDEGWEERKNLPVFKRYLTEEKDRIIHAMTELTKKAIGQANKVVDKASFYQAVTGAAILIDKTRLLTDQSTSNVAVLHKVDAESIDKLANLLSQGLTVGATLGAPPGDGTSKE